MHITEFALNKIEDTIEEMLKRNKEKLTNYNGYYIKNL